MNREVSKPESSQQTIPSKGFLKEYPFPILFKHYWRTRETGVLSCTLENIVKSVYFRNGSPCYAISNSDQDSYAEILQKSGKITETQARELHDLKKKSGGAEKGLILKMGLIKLDELPGLVKDQVGKIIISLFSWNKGQFGFVRDDSFIDRVTLLDFSYVELVQKGIATLTSEEDIDRILPRESTVIRLLPVPKGFPEKILKHPGFQSIFKQIDGTLNLRAILHRSSLNLYNSKKIVAFMSLTGIIGSLTEEIPIQKPGPEQSRPQKPIPEPPRPEPSRTEIPRSEPSRPEKPRAESFRSESPPDKKPNMEKPAPGNKMFVDMDISEELRNMLKMVESGDFYQILGVDKKVSTREIKKSYFKLAKYYHPDTSHNFNSDKEKAIIGKIFPAINEAYETLSHKQKRRKYDAELAAPKPKIPTDRKSEAKEYFNMAENMTQRGMIKEGLEYYKRAAYLDPDEPKYLHGQARALLKVGENSDLHESKSLCLQAINLDQKNAEYYFTLGLIYKKANILLSAKKQFETSLQLDPNNTRAKKELESLS